jgi:hypothetical protein
MRTGNRNSEVYFAGSATDRQATMLAALRDARSTGQTITTTILSDFAISRLLKEASHLPRRSVPDWGGVRRATLYSKTEKQANVVTRAASMVLKSSVFAPTAHVITQILATDVRSYGQNSLTDPLMFWQPNRIGFNYMSGDRHKHAHIPIQAVPANQHGLVVAVDLSGEAAGSMRMIFAKDTCDQLRMPQPQYQVSSRDDRVTLTIAQHGPVNNPL